MKYRCAWCLRYGRKPAEWQNALKLPATLPPGSISDGICPLCAAELDRELDVEIEKRKLKGEITI